MTDISRVPTALSPVPTRQAAPPPQAEAAAPNEVASDRVTLQSAEAPGFGYKLEKDGAGTQYQTWAARSGVTYEVASHEGGSQFHVELPQGALPQGIELHGTAAAGVAPTLTAHVAGQPEQALTTQMAPDGKILISLPNTAGALAMFDPQTMDYGLATPETHMTGPNGQPVAWQAMKEVVHADASRTITANAQTVDKNASINFITMMPTGATRETTFIQIDEAQGRLTAQQVTLQQPLQQAGLLAQVGGMLNSGPTTQAVPLEIQKQADGTFVVSGGGIGAQLKASLNNPLSMGSPLWTGNFKGAVQPTRVQTFATNPGLLSATGAAAGPMAAAALQAPFGAPANGVPPPPPGFIGR